MSRRNPKNQTPSSKESSKPKFQNIKVAAFSVFEDWMFGICLGFGDWDLELREA